MKKWFFILVLPYCLNSQTIYQEINQLIDKKQYTEAEVLARSYVAKNPDDIKYVELLGDSHSHQKDWDEAINQYKILVTRQPNNPSFQYKYGGALGMKALGVSKLKALGIIGDIKSAFLKAAELDPNHIEERWALVGRYIQFPGIVEGSIYKA